MKTIPFNSSFKIEQFYISEELINRGYIKLKYQPESETIKILIENQNNIIYPQYNIIEVVDGLDDIYPVEIGSCLITWNQSSSSSSIIEYPIESLRGDLKPIMEMNIGKIIQIRYISKI